MNVSQSCVRSDLRVCRVADVLRHHVCPSDAGAYWLAETLPAAVLLLAVVVHQWHQCVVSAGAGRRRRRTLQQFVTLCTERALWPQPYDGSLRFIIYGLTLHRFCAVVMRATCDWPATPCHDAAGCELRAIPCWTGQRRSDLPTALLQLLQALWPLLSWAVCVNLFDEPDMRSDGSPRRGRNVLVAGMLVFGTLCYDVLGSGSDAVSGGDPTEVSSPLLHHSFLRSSLSSAVFAARAGTLPRPFFRPSAPTLALLAFVALLCWVVLRNRWIGRTQGCVRRISRWMLSVVITIGVQAFFARLLFLFSARLAVRTVRVYVRRIDSISERLPSMTLAELRREFGDLLRGGDAKHGNAFARVGAVRMYVAVLVLLWTGLYVGRDALNIALGALSSDAATISVSRSMWHVAAMTYVVLNIQLPLQRANNRFATSLAELRAFGDGESDTYSRVDNIQTLFRVHTRAYSMGLLPLLAAAYPVLSFVLRHLQ